MPLPQDNAARNWRRATLHPHRRLRRDAPRREFRPEFDSVWLDTAGGAARPLQAVLDRE